MTIKHQKVYKHNVKLQVKKKNLKKKPSSPSFKSQRIYVTLWEVFKMQEKYFVYSAYHGSCFFHISTKSAPGSPFLIK